MHIRVIGQAGHDERLTLEELIGMAPVLIEASERVPGVEGEAFDVPAWYEAWRNSRGAAAGERRPTHLQVVAQDEFRATIPWHEAQQALFLYRQNGEPLRKGYPLRLYVPDGSSKCLNVKSVVEIRFLHDETAGGDASYGFANTFKPDDLRKRE